MENQQGLLQYEIYSDNLKLENLDYAKLSLIQRWNLIILCLIWI